MQVTHRMGRHIGFQAFNIVPNTEVRMPMDAPDLSCMCDRAGTPAAHDRRKETAGQAAHARLTMQPLKRTLIGLLA